MTFSAGAEQYLVARKTGEPCHSFLTHQGAKLFQKKPLRNGPVLVFRLF